MSAGLTGAAAAAIAPIVAGDPDPDRLAAWVAIQVGKFSPGDIDAGIEILRHHLRQTRQVVT
jgi:hypothetical protein